MRLREYSDFLEPAIRRTKGRPRANSSKRDLSSWEYIEKMYSSSPKNYRISYKKWQKKATISSSSDFIEKNYPFADHAIFFCVICLRIL